MIEIDYTLLSPDTLDNLIIEVLTRQSTAYGEVTIEMETVKNKLLQKLESGELKIVFYSQEGFCDIISSESLHEGLKTFFR